VFTKDWMFTKNEQPNKMNEEFYKQLAEALAEYYKAGQDINKEFCEKTLPLISTPEDEQYKWELPETDTHKDNPTNLYIP